MTESWPQPFEGIRGIDLSRHWVLSLDERAAPHRETLIAMARHLHTATLVGDPAPVVRRMCDRLRSPEPGDLVVTAEVMHGRRDPDSRLKGLGIYLGSRTEWELTDAQWEAYKAEDGCGLTDEDRVTDDVFYIQYGPDPGDICRWHNSSAVVLPVDTAEFRVDAAAERTETPDGGQRATFTRDSLIGGLADSGFRLRGEPQVAGYLPDNGQEATVRIIDGDVAITDVRDIPQAAGTTAGQYRESREAP
jgi:hypothetical protein